MFIRALIVCAILTTSVASVSARTINFSKYKTWYIKALFNKNGQLTFCTATNTYTSGTKFVIVYNRYKRNWLVQFYHRNWPHRRGTTPVILRVDGRDLRRTQAKFHKSSVFIDLGPNISGVKTLMRGRTLSVITPKGKSAYSLLGSDGATIEVAKCLKFYLGSRGNDGAF